jgi:NAD-dependent dihydropyrimidine dehydrogenase PreA subunit
MPEKYGADIFNLLREASQKRERKERTRFLQSMGIDENFVEGSVRINWKTCRGVECKLCIDACPTNALYWREGEVGIAEELCVFCVGCVGVCLVDDCIQVSRKRPSGEIESFSNAREVLILLRTINSKKAVERTKSRFQNMDAQLKQ